MTIEIVFETHSWSEDNDLGVATGWLPGGLSERGRGLARELGQRHVNDGIVAVFTSDLRRATETVELAFSGTGIPSLADWRLRECDFGLLNGAPAAEVHTRRLQHLSVPYPGGESWEEAIQRAGRFLSDLSLRWGGQRVLVVGHLATRWALDHFLDGVPLDELIEADFAWKEGWEYLLED